MPQSADPLLQPTRARIFAWLADLGRAAATEEVAAELAMHPNGVRRHLELLERAGVVERARVRHGRGRPRDVWALAEGARARHRPPERYRDLARWLARATASTPRRLREVEIEGREVGRELAPPKAGRPARAFRDALSSLGFDPVLELTEGGELRCCLRNCPYVESVRENPDVVCTLHRGITAGLLERLAPGATLTRWEPHDPSRAGCIAAAERTGWGTAELDETAGAGS